MFLSQVIHVLELITAVLFFALGRQLFLCYRASVMEHQARKSVATEELTAAEEESVRDSVIRVTPAQLQQPAANTEVAEVRELKAVASKKVAPAPSEDILTDYIGGFFETAESTSMDISAFKAPTPEKVVQPVVQEEELEDDSIITVAEEPVAPGTNKVMSEKVVHAMLDEAKLVCNS